MTKSTAAFAEKFATEIRRFNNIVAGTSPATKETFVELSSTLSQLLSLGELCPDAWSDSELEAPSADRKVLAETITKRFPKFGYYNSAAPASSEVDVSDATDDILDIYCDLNESLWYCENGNPELLLWSAKLLFGHWGRHAINLKSYLHKLIHEW